MANPAGSAANLAAVLREGVTLTAAEAVALIHEVCRQVKDGLAAAVPRDPSGLSIADHGIVLVHATAPQAGAGAGATVAGLLESLLPDRTTGMEAIPDALRTLPSRLRIATPKKGNDLSDLLAILRWHLGEDPQRILQQLAHRLDVSEPEREDDPFVDQFSEGVIPVAAAPPVESAPPTIVPAPTQRAQRRPLWAAAAVLLLVLCGYAGYRMTVVAPVATPITSTAPPAPQPSSRIAPTPKTPARSESRAPRAEPLALDVADGAFSPSFSSDGAALFFHRGRDRGQLRETALDSNGASRVILDDSAHNFHAKPSPDGRAIAFDSDRDGTRAVYLMERDGGRVRKMSGEGFAAVPSWSPDTQWLAFVRGEQGRPEVWNLWLRNLASGELKRVSAFRSGQVWSASWFPNGGTICYSHDDQLIVTDIASGRSRTFTTPVPGHAARTPAVSPDGTRIVFQVLGDGVWMLDVSSGGMTRLVADGSAEEFAWDPRGQRIAYHSRRDGRWRIWLLTL